VKRSQVAKLRLIESLEEGGTDVLEMGGFTGTIEAAFEADPQESIDTLDQLLPGYGPGPT